MPKNDLTSLTDVGGARSIMAWHFSWNGLYPFSPPSVSPANLTDSLNCTFRHEILILNLRQRMSSCSNLWRTSSSVLPSIDKSSTSDKTSRSESNSDKLLTKLCPLLQEPMGATV